MVIYYYITYSTSKVLAIIFSLLIITNTVSGQTKMTPGSQ